MTNPHSASPDTPDAASQPEEVAKPFMRTIKSFVKRAGRMGSGQERAMAELGPQFRCPTSHTAINFEAVFAGAAGAEATNDAKRPVVLEIGFGMGEATAQIALTLPGTNFLCCEVHEPGVGALLKRIGEHNIPNIRICNHDAVEVIDHMLPLASLDGVHIFFPDPWHKTKHNKRRLIQSPLVAKLGSPPQAWGLPACRHRLAALCGADSGSAERRAQTQEPRPAWAPRTGRLCTQTALPAANQVREPWHQAGPRRVGRGVRARLSA